MRNYLLILLVFSFVFSAQCQSTTANNVQDFNDDLDYLKEVLYTSHPGAFIYITKDSLDQVFSSLKFTDSETPTVLDLEKKVRIVLSRVGCIHTSISNSTFKVSKKSLPFTIYAKGDNLWITADLSDSLSTLEGSRIIAINEHKTPSMLKEIKEYHAPDGYTPNFMSVLINKNKWFNQLYQYYFDADTVHNYTIVTPTFDTLNITKQNIEFNVPKKEEQTNDTALHYGKSVTVTFDAANNLATLKISSFTGPPVFGKYTGKSKFRRILKEIKKRGYNNLAIDLRGNLGGNGAVGNSLLSFFVTEDHDVLVQKQKSKIFKYAVPGSKIGVVLNFCVGALFASRTPTLPNGASKAKIRKSRNGFQGNLFVITDGFTGSTASIVASILKYKANATMVGTETGGGENDLNGYFYPKVKLSNSKIKVQIPRYHINLDVVENQGSGVKPTIPVNYSLQDIIDGKDLEMEQIIHLISKK